MQQVHLEKPLRANCPGAVASKVNGGRTRTLVIIEHKCRALFSANLIKQFLGESSGTSFLDYWIGAALRRVKPDPLGLTPRETHALFCETANAILHVLDTNPDTQWNTMNTKDFYNFFTYIYPIKPKISTSNILHNRKVSLSYLTSTVLSPTTREHLFCFFHNIFLTEVRKKRVNIVQNDFCSRCKTSPEDLQHIVNCTASQPAVKWMRRKIEAIYQALTNENDFNLFTLNFKIVDIKRKCSVIWLIANFNSAIWLSRLEPSDNIMGNVLARINPQIDILK